jgi:hypothetical protein
MTQTLIEKLIAFAQENPLIQGITKGSDPEDNETKSTVYYFLVNSPYNEKRSDDITNLELALAEEYSEPFTLAEWPISLEKISHYPFLGELIWKR